MLEMDRTILVWASVPTREFFIKERLVMSVVEEAFVVPIYILATTSTGTGPEEAMVMDVIGGLNNITAKHCGTPWTYTSEHRFGIFAKPKKIWRPYGGAYYTLKTLGNTSAVYHPGVEFSAVHMGY